MLYRANTKAARHDRYNWTPPEGAEELPGFVEGQESDMAVTYESHTFWAVFERREKRRATATVYVRHGGGVESLELTHFLAVPLRQLIDSGDFRAAFKLCWGVLELARSAEYNGAQEANDRIKKAFVEGRLKKRKMPGRDAHKVWIEPEKETESA